MNRESGFLISQSIIDYKPTDSYGRAILAGIINTLAVSCLGVILATLLGLVVGIAQLASNPLARLLARIYVETLRDVILERLQSMPAVRATQTIFVLDEVVRRPFVLP